MKMAKKKPNPAVLSTLEIKFLAAWQCLAKEWPQPVHNHRVVSEEDTQGRTRFVTETGRVRMWQFDFTWPDCRLAVEMEGGVHSHPVKCNHCGLQVMTKASRTSTGKIRQPQKVMATFGGHTRGKAYIDNCRKYNTAHLLGWTVLRYTIDDLVQRPVQMVEEIQSVLGIVSKTIERDKTLCTVCDHQGLLKHYLTAPNPFNSAETIYGCPSCQSIDSSALVCESPGCWDRVVCGGPTKNGFMHTCRKHRPEYTEGGS